jgi:hypothetical protein
MSVETKDDLVTLGKKFYEENLKAKLEPEHNGEFVAIEPFLGKYVVDKSKVQVMIRAMDEMPQRKFYFIRIGFEFTTKIGGSSIKLIGGVHPSKYDWRITKLNRKSQIANLKSQIK